MYSIKNPHKATDDSGFHLVNKNGQLDVVRLEPLRKKDCKCFHGDLGSKRISPKGDSNLYSSKAVNVEPATSRIDKLIPETTTLYPYPKYVSNKIIQIEGATAKTGALKTYSRVRKNQGEPSLIRLKKKAEESSCAGTESATIDLPITIKTEPDLDIVDEEPQITKKDKKDNQAERVPLVEHVIIGNKSVKPVQKANNPAVFSTGAASANATNFSAISNILELANKTIKCNVCGMVFQKGDNQVITLGRHFLEHKTSVVNVGKKYNDDTLNQQRKKLNDTLKKQRKKWETCDQIKKPVILNKLLKNVQKTVTLIPVVKTYLSPVEKIKDKSSRIGVSNLPAILKRRKLSDIQPPVPCDILHRLRSSQPDQKTAGHSHVLIGSTLIKPIKQANSIKPVDEESSPASGSVCTLDSKGSDDADDDIEIVEDRPELIVIDDNDELDKVNENVQKSIQ